MIEFQRMWDYVGILTGWIHTVRVYTCNMVRPMGPVILSNLLKTIPKHALHGLEKFFTPNGLFFFSFRLTKSFTFDRK